MDDLIKLIEQLFGEAVAKGVIQGTPEGESLLNWVGATEGLQGTPKTVGKLYNADGSINIPLAVEVLTSDKYKEWREQPQVRQLGAQLGIDLAQKGLGLGVDLGQLALGRQQSRQARQMNVAPPRYPDVVERNPSLRIALARAAARQNIGLSDSERALARDQATGIYNRSLGSVAETTGGQGGLATAAAASAANQAYRASIQEQALSEQVRRQAAQDFAGLVAQSVEQDRNTNQFRAYSYLNQRPVWERQFDFRNELASAGDANRFGAAQALVRRVGELNRNFQTGVNEVYEPVMVAPKPPVAPQAMPGQAGQNMGLDAMRQLQDIYNGILQATPAVRRMKYL